jgi:hypothetical protein
MEAEVAVEQTGELEPGLGHMRPWTSFSFRQAGPIEQRHRLTLVKRK